MADEAPDTQDGAEEKPKKKKGLLFIIIGVVILLLGGGGFFAYTKFLAPEPAIDPEEEAQKVEEQKVGEMFPLEPFVVNLSDPKGKRYLKLKITIELESADILEKAQKNVPKMRDMVIMMLTSLTFEEVMTPEGKIRVRDELLERFNHTMRPNRINNIFFTEFVVQ